MKRLSAIFFTLLFLATFAFFVQPAQSGSMSGAYHGGDHFPPAWAYLRGTGEDSPIKGKVKFYETDDGLKAFIHLSGVSTPGKHGIHIHENGSCDDAGAAAGGHYNPHNTEHGLLSEDGLEKAHAGDMGNIEIDADGDGLSKVDLPGLSISGENAIAGKAVILHEKEDDFGQPTGNAGGRIACGIITTAETAMKEMKGDHHGSMKGSDHGSMKGSQ